MLNNIFIIKKGGKPICCPVCKKNYKMTPNSRTSLHQGCSYCAKRWQTSFPEQAILFYLTNIFTNVQRLVK